MQIAGHGAPPGGHTPLTCLRVCCVGSEGVRPVHEYIWGQIYLSCILHHFVFVWLYQDMCVCVCPCSVYISLCMRPCQCHLVHVLWVCTVPHVHCIHSALWSACVYPIACVLCLCHIVYLHLVGCLCCLVCTLWPNLLLEAGLEICALIMCLPAPRLAAFQLPAGICLGIRPATFLVGQGSCRQTPLSLPGPSHSKCLDQH